MDFIRKQFIDVIHWTEEGDGVLAMRYPMRTSRSSTARN
jgi:membrane protease subunit (stomatin/prohibitin family)